MHIVINQKMKHQFLQIVLSLCMALLFFTGCQHKKSTATTLAEAEAMMYTCPDSALQMLEAIPHPDRLTGQEQADYALLLSFARYRCYVPATSDSLINIAVQYYQDKDDADKRGMAYYVWGSILQECNGDMEVIIQAYKDAEQQIPDMKNHETVSRIYSRLGFLNQSAGNYNLGKKYYKEAIIINKEYNNNHSLTDNYLNLFTLYYLSSENDSVDWCANQLLQLEKNLTDSVLKSKIYQNIGVRYMYLGNLIKAEEYLTASLRLNTNSQSPKIWFALANLYRNSNRMEKADSLYVRLSTHPDIVVRTNAYKNILCGLLNQSSKEAYFLFNQYTESADSAYKQLYNTEINALQNQYDRVVLEKENARLYTRWLLSIIGFIFFLFFLNMGVYLYYRKKKKELNILRNKLLSLEKEKMELMAAREEVGEYRSTMAEKEERLEALNLEINKLQGKVYRIKDTIKRLEVAKERIHTSETGGYDKGYKVYQSLIQQGVYHPAADRLSLKLFLNDLFHGFADRLSVQYPTLKDRDLDICYMMALQLNSDEMAKILDVNTDSIKRYIRKITKEMQSVSQDSMKLQERIEGLKKRNQVSTR